MRRKVWMTTACTYARLFYAHENTHASVSAWCRCAHDVTQAKGGPTCSRAASQCAATPSKSWRSTSASSTAVESVSIATARAVVCAMRCC
eukprot:IDg17996t1